MTQNGIETKPDRILVFEPWGVGIYGANLMLDDKPLPVDTRIGLMDREESHAVTVEPLSGLLSGVPGLKVLYVLAQKDSVGKSLRFRIRFPDGHAVENVRLFPDIIYTSNPSRSDPFRRTPLIEVKHFTTRPPRS